MTPRDWSVVIVMLTQAVLVAIAVWDLRNKPDGLRETDDGTD